MKVDDTLFSFVPNRVFKAMLESDYKEMHKCIEAGCYKSALIIAGSVIECMAVFCLQSLKLWPTGKGDVLNAPLHMLIDEMHNKNLISRKAKDLSTVVREFRNLIHPGRILRTEESIDAESAEVAAALVNIVASEISKVFVAQYGLTADQLIEKLRIDMSAANLASHYLRRMSEAELERLVVENIPSELNRQVGLSSNDNETQLQVFRYGYALETLFDVARRYKGELVTRRFAEYYIKAIRSDSAEFIELLDLRLFHGSMFKQFNNEDYLLVRDHWKSRLTETQFRKYYRAIKSLSMGLRDQDLGRFFLSIFNLYMNTDEEHDEIFREVLVYWVPWEDERQKALVKYIQEAPIYAQNHMILDRIIAEGEVPF